MPSAQLNQRRRVLLIIDEMVFQLNAGKIQPLRDLQVE